MVTYGGGAGALQLVSMEVAKSRNGMFFTISVFMLKIAFEARLAPLKIWDDSCLEYQNCKKNARR